MTGSGGSQSHNTKPKVRGSGSVEVTKEDKRNLRKVQKEQETIGPQVIDARRNADQAAVLKHGDEQMTTEQFIELSMSRTANWTEEDLLLDNVYTGGFGRQQPSFSIKYNELNTKLRNGQELTNNEVAVVDHFARLAEPLGKDTTLYRMVDHDYVQALLSEAGVSELALLTNKTTINKSLQSTCVGVQSAWATEKVALKIKTPADMPVCVTSDIFEGEIVIPAGAKMRITSTKVIPKPIVEIDRSGKRPVPKVIEDTRITLPQWESARMARQANIFTQQKIETGVGLGTGRADGDVYFAGTLIEMELLGYE